MSHAVSLMFLARTLGIILLTRTQGSKKNIEAENTRQGQDVYTGQVKKVQGQEENRGQDREQKTGQ